MPVFLEGADLRGTRLKEVFLHGAFVSGARFDKADLRDASLSEAHGENADFGAANLAGASLMNAQLRNASFWSSNLRRALLCDADLRNADISPADLRGADLTATKLQGACLCYAAMDGETVIGRCLADETTDTRAAALHAARVYPPVFQFFQYANRRLGWQDWYKQHPRLRYLVAAFWLMSDYGRSTRRIVSFFLAVSSIFAAVYYGLGLLLPLIGQRGPVESLFLIAQDGQAPIQVGWILGLFRAFYFSVVTTTTLGFGDMHAHPSSFLGHVLIPLQVVLGYVLLGALVTRLGTLFTGTGPCEDMELSQTDWQHFRKMLRADLSAVLRRNNAS